MSDNTFPRKDQQILTVNQHEPGCWSGFTEALVCTWEPAYASEYKKGEECLECLALRGELIEFPPGTNKMIRIPKPVAVLMYPWWRQTAKKVLISIREGVKKLCNMLH